MPTRCLLAPEGSGDAAVRFPTDPRRPQPREGRARRHGLVAPSGLLTRAAAILFSSAHVPLPIRRYDERSSTFTDHEITCRRPPRAGRTASAARRDRRRRRARPGASCVEGSQRAQTRIRRRLAAADAVAERQPRPEAGDAGGVAGPAVPRRTTHVVDPLARPRAAGSRARRAARRRARDAAVAAFRGRARASSAAGPDGFGVFIPARWTDLPLAPGGDPEPALGVIATPDGWRRFGELLAGVRARRPGGARASTRKRRWRCRLSS